MLKEERERKSEKYRERNEKKQNGNSKYCDIFKGGRNAEFL